MFSEEVIARSKVLATYEKSPPDRYYLNAGAVDKEITNASWETAISEWLQAQGKMKNWGGYYLGTVLPTFYMWLVEVGEIDV